MGKPSTRNTGDKEIIGFHYIMCLHYAKYPFWAKMLNCNQSDLKDMKLLIFLIFYESRLDFSDDKRSVGEERGSSSVSYQW